MLQLNGLYAKKIRASTIVAGRYLMYEAYNVYMQRTKKALVFDMSCEATIEQWQDVIEMKLTQMREEGQR